MSVGPRMAQVRSYVVNNPGCRPWEVARAVGPHGSAKYGYTTIRRAVKAGLVRREKDPKHKGWGRLYAS